MGLFDKLRAEFIDIIEWVDDSRHTLVWRFPRYHNQIKNGAQLIVRPGQVAIFVLQGKLANVFQPGQYTLKTENLPILSTLAGWKYGFDSPFKAEVYFVATRQITDLKWGTPNPIMLRDSEFGPIRLRAFGVYTMKAVEPKALLKELVGTDKEFESDEITELLRGLIVSSFTEVLAKKNIAALDLASNYQEISEEVRKVVITKVDDEYGLDIPQLMIVNISLPEEVEKALDTRTQMGMIGDMGRFQQYQMGQAMTMAAGNPSGGGAAEGMGLGMGFAMANQMAGQMMQGGAAHAQPPGMAGAAAWHLAENGKTVGPLGVSQLATFAQAGKLTAATLVWSAGMANWVPAGQVPQLAALFSSAPPPLPR